jgi:hypothetical protein
VINILVEMAEVWQTLKRESKGGMPDRDVTTIKGLIYYQYAKIIARSILHAPDGTSAKENLYGFIKQTFRELQNKLFSEG